MDTALLFAARLAWQFIGGFVFYWIGWVVLKVASAGRYPASLRRAQGWEEFDAVNFVGALTVLLTVVALVARAAAH
ncbi:hypothetical protein C7405_11934 [Paraburkholderia caballeronis]|uniref:hypothetical protein n=1 Tax=Paraburkholderia caballeronis TaxID=416943 RepID=UPI0010667CDE|nr:hypothetical protein [Paraburkholderia caballeronis]TDV26727.1 hypothetical protein C7405_11934 [Paraburkholderia caballeronis]